MKAIFSGKLAVDYINEGDNFTIISKNSRALYIKNKNENIISLQAPSTELSPISILVDSGDFLENDFSKDKKFYRQGKKLILGHRKNLTVSLGKTKTYDPFIRHIKVRKDMDFYEDLALFILKYKKSSGLNQYFFDEISNNFFIISHLINSLKDIYVNKDKGLYDKLSKLVGLGVGLTPSADDFLTGFLSASFFFKNYEIKNLIEKINKNLARTNEISAYFLKLASKAYFSKPIVDFYRSDKIKNNSLKKSFYNLGSSSGLDSLMGIYFYISIFKKALKKPLQ